LELNQGLEVLHDLMRVHSAHRAKVILLNRLRLTMKVNTDGKRSRGERSHAVKVPSFIFLRYRLQYLQQDLRYFAGALHF
jgi:hypothetical protein